MNKGCFTLRAMYIYGDISFSSSEKVKMFQTTAVDNQKAHFMLYAFFWVIPRRLNILEPDRAHMTI
jgi:hypothetical protein